MNTSPILVAAASVLLTVLPAVGQNPPAPALDTAYTAGAYRVFTGAGAPASLDDVVRAMARQQVVFIGETHDDPTGHMLEANPKALVLHMVGGFHVERFTGTPEQLQTYAPGTRALVVSLRPVQDVDKFEAAPEGRWGHFVLQTDKSRTLEEIECRKIRAGSVAPK